MIKKGLKVKILTGKDKKKEGEVIEIDRANNRAKVKEMNMVKKHVKTTKELADLKDNIVLIGTQANTYRQIADDVNAVVSQDLSSFRLTLERLYGLIR